MDAVTIDKDGLIIVLLFLLCVAVSYIVNEFMKKRSEEKKEMKTILLRIRMQNAKNIHELLSIITDELFWDVKTQTFLQEYYNALERIAADSKNKAMQTENRRKEEQG